MDNLRGIFKDNRSQLYIETLDGHEKRFRQKLEGKLHTGPLKKMLLNSFWYAAAASVAILFVFILTSKNQVSEKSSVLLTQNKESLETEIYLQTEVARRIETIKSISVDKKQKAVLLTDVREFDKSLFQLKSDLKEAPGDQRVVNAVINTYLKKIEALDNIVFILQKNGRI